MHRTATRNGNGSRSSGLPQDVLDDLRSRGTLYTEASGKLFYEVHVLAAADIEAIARHGYSLSHVDIGNGLKGVCAVFEFNGQVPPGAGPTTALARARAALLNASPRAAKAAIMRALMRV